MTQFKIRQFHIGNDYFNKDKEELNFKIGRNYKGDKDIIKQAIKKKYYKDVALIDAKNLEHAFHIGNVEHDKVKKFNTFYSLSVGDIVEDVNNGNQFVVASLGFFLLQNKYGKYQNRFTKKGYKPAYNDYN
tara:strand:- start:585 stop:977 length:393 start_codon:yes stop_codon:yes gene_type:complete